MGRTVQIGVCVCVCGGGALTRVERDSTTTGHERESVRQQCWLEICYTDVSYVSSRHTAVRLYAQISPSTDPLHRFSLLFVPQQPHLRSHSGGQQSPSADTLLTERRQDGQT